MCCAHRSDRPRLPFLPMTLHYRQTREESAALLKRVIAELGQHDAPFTPRVFTVWYEHFAGINPRLSLALERARGEQPRLGPEALEQLFRDHVADPDAATTQDARQRFESVMQAMVRQAEATGRDAAAYGEQLQGLSRALGDDAPAAALGKQVDTVASGTSRMQSAVAELQQTVADSQAEIERLRAALDRTRTEAVTDALSQLLNRKGFDERLAQVLAQPAPDGRRHCLVILDLDHFKKINDTHGHLVGDTVIQVMGQVLQRVARESGTGTWAGRVGGEEFALLMAASSPAEAARRAQEAQTLLRGTKIRRLGSQETIATVTLSAGVAGFGAGDTATTLWAAADAALYRSKQNGRDRVTLA
jgi:diguanylate cyclase